MLNDKSRLVTKSIRSSSAGIRERTEKQSKLAFEFILLNDFLFVSLLTAWVAIERKWDFHFNMLG